MGLLHFLFSNEKKKITELEEQIASYRNIHPEIAHLYNVPYEESNFTYEMTKVEYLQAIISSIKDRLEYNAMWEQEKTEWYKRIEEEETEIAKRRERERSKYMAEAKAKVEAEAKAKVEAEAKAKVEAEAKARRKFQAIKDPSEEFTPQELFNILSDSSFQDFTGVYIIINEVNNKVYVGQAKNVLKRLRQHFSGQGNHDVYADYKFKQKQKIRTISLTQSGYENLDNLERDYIEKYNSFLDGYNKTRGNK